MNRQFCIDELMNDVKTTTREELEALDDGDLYNLDTATDWLDPNITVDEAYAYIVCTAG